jgi:hypothetical protein
MTIDQMQAWVHWWENFAVFLQNVIVGAADFVLAIIVLWLACFITIGFVGFLIGLVGKLLGLRIFAIVRVKKNGKL